MIQRDDHISWIW